WKTPALVTTPSSPPKASTALATAAAISFSSPTSAGAASAVPSAVVIWCATSLAASAARSTTVTATPSRASRSAVARPMPLAPPVTSTLFTRSARYPGTVPSVSEPPLVGVIRIYEVACNSMGSPFYGELLDRMAGDVAAGGPVGRFLDGRLDSAYEDSVPL